MIRISGAKIHNLKNISLELPKGVLICITGPSGSGKSSLAFDTICQEGRRRYLAVLDLGKTGRITGESPFLEAAQGLPPSIGLEQKVPQTSPRSTVGTLTGLLDYFRVLFAELGSIECKTCQNLITSFTLSEILEKIKTSLPLKSKFYVLAPLWQINTEGLRFLQSEGFQRFLIDDQVIDLTEESPPQKFSSCAVLVDRLIMKEGAESRLEEALRLAFSLTQGVVWIKPLQENLKELRFTRGNFCPFCGTPLPELRPEIFSFNHPLGACPHCQGLGETEKGLCPACKGKRLKPESLKVFLGPFNFADLAQNPIKEALKKLSSLKFEGLKARIFESLLTEIKVRSRAMLDLNLGHLNLFRPCHKLSLGELQRLRLSAFFGESLSGCLYVFDEPGVGLSPAEKEHLLFLLESLIAQGNTVIVVEHDPLFITASQVVVEMGPGAGRHGGEILFVGSSEELISRKETPTGAFLSGQKHLSRRPRRPKGILKIGRFKVPKQALLCLAGPSGAGKSSLLKELAQHGETQLIAPAEPRGRESIVISYIEGFKILRELLASTKEARAMGLKPAHFSFFTKEGRCPVCKGLGRYEVKIPHIPSLWAVCEECLGTKFRRDVLAVKYRGLNIHELLKLTVEEALSLLARVPRLSEKLALLTEVGLGYLPLGQEISSLSGGERQRLRLSRLLLKGEKARVLLFDVPSIGLHFEDVNKLLALFDRLIEQGYTLIVADNHPAFVLLADELWEIQQGKVIFSGTPEAWLKQKGQFARLFEKYLSLVKAD
ncbi:excinuclease ABC subunit UvrA [Thermodesulfatator autotrophicus]|uniref:UvrABC system protein A n=1 Tax=Thermodesulfatator autotrophicus TaxID=1795632 RepID=A0A177E776_9BACT|nr:hypothetical protein [Thermodesulfatator autotrophicus]OAG27794.1 hypothetical protein TH606_04970 [Thermodesulfatator autotrophicus]